MPVPAVLRHDTRGTRSTCTTPEEVSGRVHSPMENIALAGCAGDIPGVWMGCERILSGRVWCSLPLPLSLSQHVEQVEMCRSAKTPNPHQIETNNSCDADRPDWTCLRSARTHVGPE